MFFPAIIFLIGMSVILAVWVASEKVIAGTLSIGNIAEFIIYVNMLTWPVAVVGWVTSIVQQAEVSQKRINQFLMEKPNIINHETAKSDILGDIEFKNVSFTYEDTGITALKNVSFKIKQGETLAILGRTGSGKSTIAALIARLYDVSSGTIFIDNKPIKEVNLDSLRESIGFVPQDAFLFSDTIKDNIKIGNELASDEQIEQAAKSAYIYHNIEGFNQKFETLVGERGVTLSGGQKQRISIARALISSPEILIFDDCLSAVDTETEEIILQNLNEATKGKTTIIISHRASSVKNADHIIILEDGEIAEAGTHDELVEKTGYYQDIYNQQLEEKLTNS